MNKAATTDVQTAEQRLVDRAARGDRDAQRQLFEELRDAVYRVAYRLTGRSEDALDVVQDAFIRAFGQLSRFERGASFRTWLLRIATNRALDLLRSRRVRYAVPLHPVDDSEPRDTIADPRIGGPDESLDAAESAARARAALEVLPIEQRCVFAMFAEGGMTYGEIAEAVGVPIGTVMSRIFHARRKLRELLGDLWPEQADEVTRERPG
ncbi:MAG: ECF RNA polymerase sigma factor SigE [Phycisphaerae bacterium]|nr:ECF RNA polymerase sigma factor SigE [Phycisphaerae bacterium]